jgi:adenylate cyclase
MGDDVNLGSRLEGVNKKYGTHILISESTKNQLENLFATREVDLIKVKGKETPVMVYELLAEKEGLSDEGSKLLMLFNEGMELYKKRNFKDAHLAFKKVLEIYPEDSLTKLYVERSDMLSNYPPNNDWDGVFEMKSK